MMIFWIWRDEVLFPNSSERLLMVHPAPNAAPQPASPPYAQFWSQNAIL